MNSLASNNFLSDRELVSSRQLNQLSAIFAISIPIFVYFSAMCWAYLEFIQPVWAFFGFKNEFDSSRLPLSVLVVVAISLVHPKRLGGSSDLFLILVIYFAVIPALVMYLCSGSTIEYLILNLMMYTLILIGRTFPISLSSDFEIPLNNIIILSLSLSVVMTGYLFWKIGTEYFSLDFVEVYERRAFYNMKLSGSLDGYIGQYAIQINLLCTTIALYARRYLFVIFSLGIAVLLFGLMGHKSQIVAPFAVLVLGYIVNLRRVTFYISYFLAFFMAYIAFYYIYTDDPIELVANTVRRIAMVPAVLNEAYINFANSNFFVYWGDSKVGFGLVTYTERMSPANIIGHSLTGDYATHANTGLVGAGYLQAGFFGVAVYSIIMGIICSYLDKLSAKKGIQTLSMLIVIPVMLPAILSSDLPGHLFSGGLGFALLFIYLFPRQGRQAQSHA